MFNKIRDAKHLKTAAAVFALCFSVNLFVSFSIYQNQTENRILQKRLDLTTVENIVSDLASSVYEPVDSLRTVISASHAYDLNQKTEAFHRFIESKQLLKTFPGVLAWSYAEVIDYDARGWRITSIDNEPGRSALGYKPIRIVPEPKAGDALAISTMAVPRHIADKVLGYNILSSPFRREVAVRALKAGSMQFSPRITLKTGAPGAILFAPVYRTKVVPATATERRENVIGFLMAVYATHSLFASVIDQFNNVGLDVDVYDYGPINAEERPTLNLINLLSSSHMGNFRQPPINADGLIEVSDADRNYRDIEVAGRVWRIVTRYQDGYVGAGKNRLMFTGLFFSIGFALCILLAALVYMQLSASAVLSRKVAARTKALTDVKAKLEQSRDEAEQLSVTDSLTGLSNRRGLRSAFDQLIATTSRDEYGISLMIVDIDYFKSINDTHGHDAGDAILTSFAEKVKALLHDDTVCFARLGGDEFAIVFARPKGLCGTFKLGETIIRAMSSIGQAAGVHSVTASIGIAKMGVKDETLSDLMRNADIALYEAKKQGRARAVKYTLALGYQQKRKDALFQAVNTGLERNEFEPVFHPYICMNTGKIGGFEVLARWQHPSRGLLTPAAFWEALCDEGLATRISNMVIQKAFDQAGKLISRGIDVPELGVNVTTQMLEDETFAESIIAQAEYHGLTPSNLKIEVTERILLSRNADLISSSLTQLADAGVSVAFDDFGTGFASLVHLQSFPLDCVKIDRSFVRKIHEDDKSVAIISGVIKIAHDLGFHVIAEGVETEMQRDMLCDLDCDAIQGFLYAKPGDIHEVEKHLTEGISVAA